MKRLCSMLMSCLLLVSTAVLPVNAAEKSQNEISQNSVSMTDLGVSILENYTERPSVDLTTQTLETNFRKVLDEADLSSAVDITADITQEDGSLSGTSKATDSLDADNQAPVANPQILILNPESMQDGKHTTGSIFFLATRLNGVDLCYDPEGDPLTLIHNTTFPNGYISTEEVDLGENAGYVIQILSPGTYPFAFAFVDSQGSSSQTFSIVFDIIMRGKYEVIEDSLSSLSDVKIYDITVDYSAANEYNIAFIRTGTGGFNVTVLNPDGSEYDTAFCSGPSYNQETRVNIELKSAEGQTGSCTYKVQISSNGDDENISYKIAYGEVSQSPYFLEGLTNSLDLPYYHRIRNYDQNEAEYVSRNTLSEIGDYYKITATGTETVTLGSTYGKQRFRIIDGESFAILYDGIDLSPFQLNEYSSYYISADLNFTEGKTYYINVYNPETTSLGLGSYSIMVGDPKVYYNTLELDIPKTEFVKGRSYEWYFTLESSPGRSAYADSVSFRGSDAGWTFEGGKYYIQVPGSSTWINNEPLYYSDIDFKYDDLNTPLVLANGTWRFRLVANKTGTYPGRTLYLHYWFEI